MMTRDRSFDAKEAAQEYGTHAIITVVIVSLFQLVASLLPSDSDTILEAIRQVDVNSQNRHQRSYDKLEAIHTAILLQSRMGKLDVTPSGLDHNSWAGIIPQAQEPP